MLIALLPSRKYQPHRNQLDGLGTKTLLMKKTRQALLCRLLLALQAAAHRRLARLQPWPRWLPILIRSFAIYGYESEGYIASWFENFLFKISGNWCCHSRNFLYFFLSCWPLWRRFFNHYHIGRYIFKLPSSWIVYVQFHLWWTIVCFNVWLLLRLTMHLIFLIELLFLLVWQNKTQDIKSTENTCRTFDCCFKRILKVGEWWVAL